MENNKGCPESRTLETRAITPEDVGFPFAAQAALLTRQHIGRQDETVALVTSLAPEQLSAQGWLRANRQGWGIENGLHQRLDVSLNDDRCRVRNPNALWILGMFRRLTVSLFMEWRRTQPKAHFKSLTDFHAAMGEENLTPAMRFVTNQRPTFQNAFMHTRCVEALCQKLNLTKTLFPGSRLRLRYAIRDAF